MEVLKTLAGFASSCSSCCQSAVSVSWRALSAQSCCQSAVFVFWWALSVCCLYLCQTFAARDITFDSVLI